MVENVRRIQRHNIIVEAGMIVEAPGAGHFELVDPRSATWPLVLEAVQELLAR